MIVNRIKCFLRVYVLMKWSDDKKYNTFKTGIITPILLDTHSHQYLPQTLESIVLAISIL